MQIGYARVSTDEQTLDLQLNSHANGLAAWEALGRPAAPERAQLAELRQTGALPLSVRADGSVAYYELAVS